MRQLQWMIFQQGQLGIISITQKKPHQMENIITITTQQNQTSLKYGHRSCQFSWAVEITDITEEA